MLKPSSRLLVGSALLCASLVGGCRGGSAGAEVPDAPPAEAPPAPLVPSVEGVEVTRDGLKVPFRGAALYTRGTSARYLDLSTEPLTCAAYEPGGRSTAKGEVTLSVDFAPLLQPDGSSVWTARELTLGERGSENAALPGLRLLRAEDAAAPVGFSFDQDLVLPASDFFGHAEEALGFHGDGVAEGCGPWLLMGLPPAPQPQPKLAVSIAGRSLPILSAALVGRSDAPKLRLSTHPIHCAGGPADVLLELQLDEENPGDGRRVYLRGDILPVQTNNLAAAEALKVELAPAAPGAAQHLTLQGTFELSGYKVQVNGEVEAVDCRE